MKGLIRASLNKRVLIYFICLLLFFGGIFSFFTLGQLEDPVFTVKSAVIVTKYPGASSKEVEMEVTDRIETAIQEMSQIKNIYSISRTGESRIKVDIKQEYWADRLPQVWDELRKKVHDIIPKLPPGAKTPDVSDDFGNVFGFVLALTGDGYSYKSLESYAKIIKKELGLVKGVARVELWGVQNKVIYLDVSEKQLSELNLTAESVLETLKEQNMVVDAGYIDDTTNRFRIAPTGEFSSPEEIGELILRPTASDIITNVVNVTRDEPMDIKGFEKTLEDESSNVIRVKDVVKVRSGYQEPARTMMRYDGKPAIGIQISGSEDANIVDVGERLYARLEQVIEHLPVGLDVEKVAWQSDLVDEAINSFLISLLMALVIVLIVLMIPCGFRMGCIIGIDLVLTILGTFIVMSLLDIPLQRMSLGALIIALGMMVDNSIVIADGIAVGIRQKMSRVEAAFKTASASAYPLFAATLIATLTFYPIFASREDAGEYCRSLFIVVAASLIISWLIAIFITPLQCIDLLKENKKEKGDEFQRPLFRIARGVIQKLMRFKGITILTLGALLISSVFGFGFVRHMFFPDSSRPQLMIDYWADADSRIQLTSENMKIMEQEILKDPTVSSVTSFIGAGPPRFYLPVEPEKSFSNYGELIVNFNDYTEINPFIEKFKPWAEKNMVGAMIRFRKFGVGPSNTWKFEARISGPGEADLTTLRELGNQVKGIAEKSPLGTDWMLDMQNPVMKVVPDYDQKKGRWANVSRLNVANATKRSYDGLKVGLYREKDDLYPIVLRNIESEREDLLDNLQTLQVKPSRSTTTIPLSQVVNQIETKWEDPIIARWDRRRAVTVQGSPKDGVTLPELKKDVIDEIDQIKLPPGYELFWDGEEDSTISSQRSLIPGIIPAAIFVLLLLVSVFNEVRPVVIILITIPFAFIGVTFGLLTFSTPFGFMALLGAMSLAGMMNKNIVVLLDACRENLAGGMSHHDAILEAAISRARPVLLAAGTTILGVIPLLFDVFWVSMAVTIMVGLAFGSLLTLIAVPVFYSLLYRIKRGEKK